MMKSLIKERIEFFLLHKMDSTKLWVDSIEVYEEIFKELGFDVGDDKSNFETNGWQVDFWWTISKDDISYTLSGSLYYGDFRITKNKN